MKKTSILALAICIACTWPTHMLADEAKPRHLFILSGQSNMTGNLKQGFQSKVEKAFGAENITIALSMRSGRGIRFWVEDYHTLVNKDTTQKKPPSNGEEYPRLLAAAKAAGQTSDFQTVTFVWMQGESDATKQFHATYEAAFKNLYQRLIKDLGIVGMHVVIGRISDFGLNGDSAENWKQVRAAQEKLAMDIQPGSWVNTDDLNDVEGKPNGDLHYPKAGSIIVGERLGEQAIALIEKATKKSP